MHSISDQIRQGEKYQHQRRRLAPPQHCRGVRHVVAGENGCRGGGIRRLTVVERRGNNGPSLNSVLSQVKNHVGKMVGHIRWAIATERTALEGTECHMGSHP